MLSSIPKCVWPDYGSDQCVHAGRGKSLCVTLVRSATNVRAAPYGDHKERNPAGADHDDDDVNLLRKLLADQGDIGL